MNQLHNSRPKSLTPLRPVLTANANSPPRKHSPSPNKTFLAHYKYHRGRKDEFFRNLTENSKIRSFLAERHETEPCLEEADENKDIQISNFESKSPEYMKNDNHFHAKLNYNVPIHIRNLSGDISFPNSVSPLVKTKPPKILKKLPNISPGSPNQRLNTTMTHNERYSTPEDFQHDREPRFFTEGNFDEKSYTPISKYAETKTSKLTDLTRLDSKGDTFHLRSGSFGASKTFIRKQIAMKNVQLDLSAQNHSNIEFPAKTATKFQITNKFNKPGPYRIKFFHEERERVAREYANFYQIGDNLKKLERTNPIPIHIREYIHKLNNLN